MIKETGVYKLSDGTKVFITMILEEDGLAFGTVDNDISMTTWFLNGTHPSKKELNLVERIF